MAQSNSYKKILLANYDGLLFSCFQKGNTFKLILIIRFEN